MSPAPSRLDIAQAHAFLHQHANPSDAWVGHCRQVAKVARHLGDALLDAGADFDLELLEVRALLHDIGRSKTHGPLHGWSGFCLLQAAGYAREGRGCLTHWLKGRSLEEVAANPHWQPSLAGKAFAALDPPSWELADSVLSVADSSVQHTTIVSMTQRHQDLIARYGPSPWLQRAAELAANHAAELEESLGFPIDQLLHPLFGDSDHAHLA